MTPLRAWLLWLAGFLFFPLAGVLSGRATSLLAGVITGLVIGIGQSLLSARRLDWRRWVPASTVGMGVGLALGGAAVGHRTGLGDLALMGAITGIVYLAQGILTPDVLALSVLLGVPFVLAMWAGSHWFHGASELAYRRVAYAIIVLAAIVSLPLWDGWLR